MTAIFLNCQVNTLLIQFSFSGVSYIGFFILPIPIKTSYKEMNIILTPMNNGGKNPIKFDIINIPARRITNKKYLQIFFFEKLIK